MHGHDADEPVAMHERSEHLRPGTVVLYEQRRRRGIGVLEILLNEDVPIAVQRDERCRSAQVDPRLATQGTHAIAARLGHDREAALRVLESQRRAAGGGARHELLDLALAAGQHLLRGAVQ